MKLEKVEYKTLNARQKENYNFHQVAAILATYGFNSLRLNDDWQGADFLAYHVNGNVTLKVQLKSRIAISKKYLHKDIYISFPFGGLWYLISHDELVKKVSECTNWLNTESWKSKDGAYNSSSIPQILLEVLVGNRIDLSKQQQTVAETEGMTS